MDTILLIEDDIDLCTMLKSYLGRHGFNVVTVHNGERGLREALTGRFEMVLLDVMLPGLDGFEVLRRLRTSSSIGVLLLTARGEDVDRIVGLEIGADDYLPKPFNPRELLARIRAVMRRRAGSESAPAERQPAAVPLVVTGLELEVASRTVQYNGTALDLTAVEFNLLQMLMQFAGTVVDRQKLAEHALGRKLNSFDRSLDMHVSRLRRKLDEAGSLGDQVKTIRGTGYQFAIRTGHSSEEE
jgi:DNA-binding response OmpR family regulator